MRRALGTGSRQWSDEGLVVSALELVVSTYRIPAHEIVLVQGDAGGSGEHEGADHMLARVAASMGMQVDPHPANWPSCAAECAPGHRRVNGAGGLYCPTAGFRRNLEMLDTMSPGDLCLAFALRYRSGTGHCARAARLAGLRVFDFGVGTERVSR